MKILEPLKADSAGGPPGGSLRKGARPGRKGLLLKNHEAPSISWTGRANRSSPPWRSYLFVAATGRSPDRPASSCGSHPKPPGRRLARPMLFEHQAFAPGPRPKLPGNVKRSESPGRAGGFPLGNYFKVFSSIIVSRQFPKAFIVLFKSSPEWTADTKRSKPRAADFTPWRAKFR